MPNMKFEDVVDKIEKLGHKREIKVFYKYLMKDLVVYNFYSVIKFHLRGLYETRKDEPERPTDDLMNIEENENEVIERLFANDSLASN